MARPPTYPVVSASGRKPWRQIGKGNNGIVFTGPAPGTVYKWTVDPVEVAAWLAVLGLQQRSDPAYAMATRHDPLLDHRGAYHGPRGVPGFPRLFDIHLSDRSALIVREDVQPAGAGGRRSLAPLTERQHSALQHSARAVLSAAGNGVPRAASRRLQYLAGIPALGGVAAGLAALQRDYGVIPNDLRGPNLGYAQSLDYRSRSPLRGGGRGRLVLLDPGRTPIESTLAGGSPASCSSARGRRNAVPGAPSCVGAAPLASAIKGMLGHAPSYSACQIVNGAQLRSVMQQHGWSAGEIGDTAGFHTEQGTILLRRGDEWSLLHELVHAAGVVDKDLAPWLVEGITEAAAQAVAQHHGWKHTPTYPEEVTFVVKTVGPAARLNAVGLAKLVAAAPKTAGRRLATRLAQGRGGRAEDWYRAIGPTGGDFTQGRKALTALLRG